MPKICDSCKVCVRRCPAGAIPTRRAWHRGVERMQIREDRCWPTVVQSRACAICAKVCPAQRYGLQAVIEEFTRSGRILGKDSDELEGFDWVDGEHHGPGRRPKPAAVSFTPPGWHFEPERTYAP